MADINQALNNIQNAVYGEEVRQSIHDGIEAINNQQNEFETSITNQENTYEENLTNRQNTYEEGINNRQTNLEQDWVTVKQNAEDATENANTSASFATTQGNFAKAEGEALVNTINQFNYIGEYNPLTNYQPKNMVKYHGSTFVNKVACKGILPTDGTHWQVIATGYVIRGNYDSNSTYEIRDICYYSIEKKFYECIQPAGLGISPYSTANWKVLLDVSDMIVKINDFVNDSTSIYIAHNNNISITHNLNTYVECNVVNVSGSSYGHYGFGMGGFSDNDIYQLKSRLEYDKLNPMNKINILLDESFEGTPTITPIDTHNFSVTFSVDPTELRVILK